MHRRTLTTEAKQTHGRTSLGLVRPAEGRGTNAEGRGTNSLRIFSAYSASSPRVSVGRPSVARCDHNIQDPKNRREVHSLLFHSPNIIESLILAQDERWRRG